MMRRIAIDVAALLNADGIAPFQWRHLRRFYISLLCVSASSALGSYCTEFIGSFFALSGALASWYCFNRTPSWHEKKRAFLLSLGACFGWAFLSPWLTWYLGVDTGFIVTLLSSTCVGFGCYLICSSVFGGDSAHWKYQVYPLILWFMVYVAAYSQSVMWKARGGESDYVKHAYSVFTDLPLVVIHFMKMMKAWWFR